MQIPGDTINIPIVVEQPMNAEAFGLQLTHPACLLTFREVSPTSLTNEWTILDGLKKKPGIVSLGGFHTEGFTSDEAEALAEVTFTVREDIKGSGEFVLSNLIDDLADASDVKGNFSTKLTPQKFALDHNYLNPFNSHTDMRYQTPESRSSLHTTLKITHLLGQEVMTLVNEDKEPGHYTITWNGKDTYGNDVASGMYVYRLQVDDISITKRTLLVK